MSLTDSSNNNNGLPEDTDSLTPIKPNESTSEQLPDPALTAWIMEHVNRWSDNRDSNYLEMWKRYERLFRGKWDPSLMSKQAERSRIITPLTQSAIDQAVSEMAEAVFGRGVWFDIDEENPDPKLQEEAELIRDNLIDDFGNSKLKSDVVATFYNGAIFGTGIAKRSVDIAPDGTKYLKWVPIRADNFVIDTAATTIDEALGCAHQTIRPKHEVEDLQASGEYYDGGEVSSVAGVGSASLLQNNTSDLLNIDAQDGVMITEWHGKVPRKYLPKYRPAGEDDPDKDLLLQQPAAPIAEDNTSQYVEAVIVIANGTQLLKAEENELKDRGFIAYQHYRNPGQFWGIGIAEKAYNMQVANDGEMRARADALSLTTYPIVGVDSTRMPRNLQMTIAPGKVYMTNGQPNEIIQPISFGSLNTASFQQSGDLERLAQMATGATDPAKPVNGNVTASGQSQGSAAYIKRAKLTMQAVDTDFLSPLVRKSVLGYASLNPQRYPSIPTFNVQATMSIMAKEFEQAQLTNLLAIIPQASTAFPIILKGIMTNYSGPSRDKLIEAIDASNAPPTPEQQAQQAAAQQMAAQTAQANLDKLQAEVAKLRSEAGLTVAKAQTETVKTQLAPVQARIAAMQVANSAKTADTQARQVEVDAAKVQIDHHHRTQDHVHKKVANSIALEQYRRSGARAVA